MKRLLTLLLLGLSMAAIGQQNFTNQLDEKGQGDRKIPLFKRLKQFRLDYYQAVSEPHFNRYQSILYLRFLPNRDQDWPFFPLTRGGSTSNMLYGIHLRDRATGKEYYVKGGSSMPMDGGQLVFDNFGGEIQFWLSFDQLPETATSFDVYYNNTLWFSKVKIDPKKDAGKKNLQDDYQFGRVMVYKTSPGAAYVFANGRRVGTIPGFYTNGQTPKECGSYGTLILAFSKNAMTTPVAIYGEEVQGNGYGVRNWNLSIAPKSSTFSFICNAVTFN